MNHILFKTYTAIFLSALAAFLGAMFIFNFIVGSLPVKPVIVAINSPFEITPDTKTVTPGGVVCYCIHYIKYQDIPGDITKQIVFLPDGESEEMYIPLGDTAGHLPVGEVKKKACIRLPDWLPPGKGRIKLSSTYTGKKCPPNVAWTKEFKVVKP